MKSCIVRRNVRVSRMNFEKADRDCYLFTVMVATFPWFFFCNKIGRNFFRAKSSQIRFETALKSPRIVIN